MCRMIGVVGLPSVPLPLFLAFRELATRGRYLPTDGPGHLDGWGAGWSVHEGKPRLMKAAVPVIDPKGGYFEALVSIKVERPRIAIAHVRKASVGGWVDEDTHPFEAEGWLFCHNGTVFDHGHLPLRKHQPRGGTDSERFFLFTLEQMDGDAEAGVRHALEVVRRHHPYTSLTFLLTDGRVLIAYRDVGEPNEGTVKDCTQYYTLYALLRPDVCVVCSEPLPVCGLPWRKLADGELLIISRDAQVLRQVNLKESVRVAARS